MRKGAVYRIEQNGPTTGGCWHVPVDTVGITGGWVELPLPVTQFYVLSIQDPHYDREHDDFGIVYENSGVDENKSNVDRLM